MFRLIYTHSTRLDLASDPHESALNFIDSTSVRPTLDKSSDAESTLQFVWCLLRLTAGTWSPQVASTSCRSI